MLDFVYSLRQTIDFFLRALHGGIIFIIFLQLHSSIANKFSSTILSEIILKRISNIESDFLKSVAGMMYIGTYDMLILFMISTVVTLIIVKFGFTYRTTICYSLQMTIGAFGADVINFTFQNSSPLSIYFFQSLMLFSVNIYFSIGIVFLNIAICYWISLKICNFAIGK